MQQSSHRAPRYPQTPREAARLDGHGVARALRPLIFASIVAVATMSVVGPRGKPRPDSGGRRAMIALGGLGLAISPFMTWMHVALLGGLNLFQLLKADGDPTGIVWIAVLIGIGIALATGTGLGTKAISRTAMIVGLIAGACALLVIAGLVHATNQADGLASMSYGPWIALISCAAMVLGGGQEFSMAPATRPIALTSATPPADPVEAVRRCKHEVEAHGAMDIQGGWLMAAFGRTDMRLRSLEEVAALLREAGLQTAPELTHRRIYTCVYAKTTIRITTCE